MFVWKYFQYFPIESNGSTQWPYLSGTRCYSGGYIGWNFQVNLQKQLHFRWRFRNCGYCYGCLVFIYSDLGDICWSSKQTSATCLMLLCISWSAQKLVFSYYCVFIWLFFATLTAYVCVCAMCNVHVQRIVYICITCSLSDLMQFFISVWFCKSICRQQ